MINMLAQLLKVLNSETEPGQISLAFCFAMVVGLTPLYSLHNLAVLFLVLSLRVNIAAFMLALPVFTACGYLLDPLFHVVGGKILTASSLVGLFTSMYNMALFRIGHFNNTIVMGSLVISFLFFVPLFFISNMLVRKYRERFLAFIEKTKLVQILKSSKLYSLYKTVSD